MGPTDMLKKLRSFLKIRKLRWWPGLGMRKYFYALVAKYLRFYIRPDDSVALICNEKELLPEFFPENPNWQGVPSGSSPVDYIVVGGWIHYERDIQTFLYRLRSHCGPSTRVLITFYSSLWRPLLSAATWLCLRVKTVEQNWLAPGDLENLLRLAGYEMIKADKKILCPVYIPFVSNFVNRFIAPLPIFDCLSMLNIMVARPLFPVEHPKTRASVSVVIPARNEAGNIENAVLRLPAMGPDDEIIFVEGHSSDDTWEKIKEVQKKYGSARKIVVVQQTGKGKGDAVRKGFSLASKDILMILDADLTVPPEDLPKFYNAIIGGDAEFINGSRLVYPMEGHAMRFLNLIANKFFAISFSYMIGQSLKDTLCGTKVLSRKNYEKLAFHRKFFGEFDPFGDFDLIFGAARLALRIVEVPIIYRDRVYGTTNISRWRHGLLLLRMLCFAALRMRFI